MNLFQASAEEVLRGLGTSEAGLDRGDVESRRAEYGRNTVERVRREPLLIRFVRCFTGLLALLLWLAAAMAFAAEAFRPGEGMAVLGYAILGVIAINGLFAFWQAYRAERTLAELARLLPAQVKVLRGGKVVVVPSDDLVPGDIVSVAQGDRVPADCRLIQAFAMRVTNATVTGEAIPVSRTAEPVGATDILNSPNALMAGAAILSGNGLAVVFATGRNTEFGKIAQLAQTAEARPSLFLSEIARVSRVIALVAMALGVVFFAVGLNAGLSVWTASIFAIGIIVANVPEGLLPTITLALAMAARRMAGRNVLIRHLPAVETLGSATVICTDKTGTLTENSMTVRQLLLARSLDYAAPEDLAPARNVADRRLCEVAWRCQTVAATGGEPAEWLGDPLEIALMRMVAASGFVPPAAPLRAEIPFDADRKRMSTVHDTGEGLVLYTKGAPESVLSLCTGIEAGDGSQGLSDMARRRILDEAAAIASKGLRVLALAYRPLARGEPPPDRESALVFLGLVGLEDPPRAGVAEAVRSAKKAGIKVIITTGDHPDTTVAVARQIGLVTAEDEPKVVTGDRLRHLSNAELSYALDAPDVIFARLAADQKLRIVRTLQAKGHVVAATGDGVNDAPALRRADIGIAMGRSGSDVAREAADMILVEDNFADIVAGIEEGRAVFENVRKFMTYILTSNVPEIVPYLAFALLAIPLPLTVIQILAVDLGTDLVPALGLGAEKPDPGIMRRPPRPRSRRLIDVGLLTRAYLFLGTFEALAAMSAFFFVLDRGGWSYGETLPPTAPLYLEATTACLSAIVVVQIVNVFLCRDEGRSLLRQDPLTNQTILIGIGLECAIILAIVYTPLGQAAFGTAPLPWQVWLFTLPFALLMVAADEARRRLARPSTLLPAGAEPP